MTGTTAPEPDLVVAITGPTGTFGFGLLPLLESDARVGRVVGIARRPFDPAEHGWSKMAYRQGDVRDRAALERAFAGADVVVHLAFLISGTAPRATIREINVDGTLNAMRAAAAIGARRFVFASSVAAYGFHDDNPVGMTEEWPVRPAAHLFYGQQKAELERLLGEEAAAHPGLGMYLLRPSIVMGPHTLGAKELVPERFAALVGRVGRVARRFALPLSRLPMRWVAPIPRLPVQFVHEDDVGQALLLCIVGAGPPGAYNIAADGVLSAADVIRELGLRPVAVPDGWMRGPSRAVASLAAVPHVPPVIEWAEVLTHPAIMDTAKAKRELGWRPRYSAIEAVRATLGRSTAGDADRGG